MSEVHRFTRKNKDSNQIDNSSSVDLVDNSDQNKKHLNLSQYLDNIGKVVESYCGQRTWVQCEVVTFNISGGNYYFELVDSLSNNQRIKSQSAILFKSKVFSILGKFNSATGVNLDKGMKVLFQLSAKFTALRGFSLVIEDVDPIYTIGEMEAKSNAIRKRMFDKGINNLNKNILMPSHFSSVAVISPSGAAGLGDFKVEADILE